MVPHLIISSVGEQSCPQPVPSRNDARFPGVQHPDDRGQTTDSPACGVASIIRPAKTVLQGSRAVTMADLVGRQSRGSFSRILSSVCLAPRRTDVRELVAEGTDQRTKAEMQGVWLQLPSGFRDWRSSCRAARTTDTSARARRPVAAGSVAEPMHTLLTDGFDWVHPVT